MSDLQLPREAFLKRLATLLGIPNVTVETGASLFDDWGLDSLQAFQLIVATESIAGALIPPEEIPEIWTVDDAYAYYLANWALR